MSHNVQVHGDNSGSPGHAVALGAPKVTPGIVRGQQVPRCCR